MFFSKKEFNDEAFFVNALKSKNYKAFEFLFNKYYDPLCSYSKKIVYTKEFAEDVVSQFFMDIYEAKVELNIESSFSSYLFRSIRNRSLNLLKSRRVSIEEVEESEYFEYFEEEYLKIYESELYVIINKAIEDLSPQCQKAFKLSRFENKKYSEIAEILGISINTVENHIVKALKELRNVIEEKYQ